MADDNPKKPGRPATGKNEHVGLRIPKDDLAAVDAWAKANGCSRAEAIRRLTKLGLLVGRDRDLKSKEAGLSRPPR
jgi:hypothetical protein